MATTRTHHHHQRVHADDRHPRKSTGLAGEGANGDSSKRSPAVRLPAKMKKAQVVYYLTRNGYLEHPHFMEVSHLPALPLRLKDVMDRLTALRGKGMPSLYSWSCKRSYKNGYVWNDLLENDAIHPPADGAEYVLKGSEIVESCSEIQQFDVRNGSIINCNETDRHSKRLVATRGIYSSREEVEQDYEGHLGQDAFEDEEKTSYTSSTASRCSRGISTDELEEPEHQVSEILKKRPSNEQASPPSPLLSPTMILDHKPTNVSSQSANNTSSRFAEIMNQQDVPRFSVARNSMLLQLISCGNAPKPIPKSARDDYYSNDMHKGLTCKNTAKAGEEDEAAMIVYMSENPRFGNLQSEEKEYFSGSIVESIKHDDRSGAMTEPVLKKSNSYNAERGTQSQVGVGIEEKAVAQERRDKSTTKSKCIPRMICSSSSKITKKR